MHRILAIAIAIILTSFYYFPFWFTALPAVNTKQIMAIVGVIAWGVHLSINRSASLGRELLPLSLFAMAFSLACFFSVTYNSTSDYAYATYIVSMWIWLAGAYGVCWIIRMVHDSVSLRTMSHYLIAVCMIQCALALFIDNSPAFKDFVDAHIIQGQEFLVQVKRLYGIGAMLDTAGIRFSIVLILIAHLLTSGKDKDNKVLIILYLLAFATITVIGNIIARTTLTGVILSLLYLAYRQLPVWKERAFGTKELLVGLLVIACVCIPMVTYFYNTNAAFHKNLRFGFEGFFNLIENGKWEVGSNEQLKAMIVFPKTLKTWLIGDGYFNNPIAVDPYFTGTITRGYYMGTDIGYLRFIFYCGAIGLLAFSLYICKAVEICIHRFPTGKMMILFLGILNFVVWFKVSTDIFLIFALLLVAEPEVSTDKQHKTSLPIR